MPVEVKGLAEVLTAMRKFEPDLAKNLNKEMRAAMTPIQKEARGLVPNGMTGLTNWEFKTTGKKINKSSSAFATSSFPKFNPGIVKAGIRISTGKTKKNHQGFATFFRITNLSAAGQIMEMAGRVNPNGRPKSKSNNPNAGNWFIHHMHGQLEGPMPRRGRTLFKAANDDQGKTISKMMHALQLTLKQFETRAQAQVLGSIK